MWSVEKVYVGDIMRVHIVPFGKGEPIHTLTDDCWCEPELNLRAANGNEVWVHKECQ